MNHAHVVWISLQGVTALLNVYFLQGNGENYMEKVGWCGKLDLTVSVLTELPRNAQSCGDLVMLM